MGGAATKSNDAGIEKVVIERACVRQGVASRGAISRGMLEGLLQ